MELKKNNILRINDDEEYFVADIIEYNDTKYGFLVGYYENSPKIKFCTSYVNNNGKLALKIVTEPTLLSALVKVANLDNN